MSGRSLRIGTRGSELALWQAQHVASALAKLPGAPPTELVILKTAGDRSPDVPLWQVPGKSFFTREIEEALGAGRIDLAVHSLKDLATADPPGLVIAAVLAREDPRDVLITRPGFATLEDLPPGARVGTSSLRRRALLARLRGDLTLLDLRGNVPTRCARLDEGRYDAIVLAAAGVKRLGLEARISSFFSPLELLPAPGQGALAVQVRAEDGATRALVAQLDDPATRAATTAERAFLARLEGGCQVPVGALAVLEGGWLKLAGVVCSLNGQHVFEGRREGSVEEAERVGRELAEEALIHRSPLPTHPTAVRPGEGDRGGEGLRGFTVAITRAEPPGGPLERRLAVLGARVLRWTSVEVGPPQDPAPLRDAARRLAVYDWVVFPSAHAVESLAAEVPAVSERQLPRVAAIGPGTAEAAEAAGFRVHRLPNEVPATSGDTRNEVPPDSFGGAAPDFSAAGLVEVFRAAGDAAGARVLIPCSSQARPELATGLTSLGAVVEAVVAYRVHPAPLDGAACAKALAAGEVDVITFTSPSAVEAFSAALRPAELSAALRGCKAVSIGPTTSAALRARGRAPHVEAHPSSLDGVVAAVEVSVRRTSE